MTAKRKSRPRICVTEQHVGAATLSLRNLAAVHQHIKFDILDSGVAVAEGAEISRGTFLGRGVTIYPGVTIGESCIVYDGSIIGRMPIANQTTSRAIRSSFETVHVGAMSVIGANVVIYTDTVFGSQVLIGDLASVREGCRIGDGVIIGRGVMALYNCQVGRFSRIQDQAHLVGNTIIEDHVFVGMGVVLTNDNDVYLSRFGIHEPVLKGPTIRRLAVIGSGATILPNVEIGEGALIGAGALVTKNVPPWTVVTGLPARIVREVPPEWREKVLERASAIDQAAAVSLRGLESND